MWVVAERVGLEKRPSGVKPASKLSITSVLFFPHPMITPRKFCPLRPFMSSKPPKGTDFLSRLTSKNSSVESVGLIKLIQAHFAFESKAVNASKLASSAVAFAGLVADQNITVVNIGGPEMSDVPAHIMRQAKSHDFRASVRIGKSGLSETVLEEIRQQLQSRDLVKVKVNKGLFEREQRSEVWQYVAEQTASHLVLQRGNIGVLWRR